ncbi:MAG: hypothetical protein WB660_23225, partial [Candidatus Sulfotelmatobacter sp.]
VQPKAGRHFTKVTHDRSSPEFADYLLDIAASYPEVDTIHLGMLCQEDEKSSCCTKDEGRSLEQPTRPQIWKGESPFSVNCLYQTDSISGACRGNEARSARK